MLLSAAELTFVPHGIPTKAEDDGMRKAVRSAAATYGHRQRSRRSKYSPRPGNAFMKSPRLAAHLRYSSPFSCSEIDRNRPPPQTSTRRKEWTSAQKPNIGRRRKCGLSHSHTLPPELQRASMRVSDIKYLDASRKDPFSTYPVPYESWYGWLLEFWYYHVLPRARHLIKCERNQIDDYVLWSRRFELTEPALFYTSLFLATGIPVAEGRLPLERALWLRGRAVKTLNDALNDPGRGVSTAIICAVGKIALHEHVYGDRHLAHSLHRPAQQKMIAMRGGIENLGLPTTTLQLMVWYDALMAGEAGTVAYFADLPRKMGFPGFSKEEAVQVTQILSPQRYQHPGYGSMRLARLGRT